MVIKKKYKPKKFKVLNEGSKKKPGAKVRVKPRWRRPRGIDNKKRIRKKSTGYTPKIGYKKPEDERGLHPLGLKEVLVHNVKELAHLKDVLIRIASSVGKKKREEIRTEAKKKRLRVIN